MQFQVTSKVEYISTINAIVEANIYDRNSMIYALDITEDVINKVPNKYPCIVSLEFEEFDSDNRRYAFQACKFIYTDELLSGLGYIAKLLEISNLDIKLGVLESERDTSGAGFPLEEIAELQENIYKIEKQLF